MLQFTNGVTQGKQTKNENCIKPNNCQKETFTLFVDGNIDQNEGTLSATFSVFKLTTKL